MTALQKIIAEAKKIRKKYPKKEWKDCVAQASAIYAKKHKGKSPVGKKSKKVGAVKKKAAKKKSAVKSYHKDTASHNVRINVVSGIDGALQHLNGLIKEKEKAEKKLQSLKIALKNSGDNESKKHFKFWIKKYKMFITGIKKQITESKKHI